MPGLLLNLVDLGFGFQIICHTAIVRGFQFQIYRVDDIGVSVIDSEDQIQKNVSTSCMCFLSIQKLRFRLKKKKNLNGYV